jgi:hypothetical protein
MTPEGGNGGPFPSGCLPPGLGRGGGEDFVVVVPVDVVPAEFVAFVLLPGPAQRFLYFVGRAIVVVVGTLDCCSIVIDVLTRILIIRL